MATLTIRRTYLDGALLYKADIDAIADDVETFVNTTKISDDNIQTGGITGSLKLVDASVNAAKLATDSVTTAKILDANVTAAKLASDSVTTAKIADSNVTMAKLAANSVTQSRVALRASASVAAAGDVAISSSSGNYALASLSESAITNLSVTITTLGNPVELRLICDGTGPSYIAAKTTSLVSGPADATLQFYRGATGLGAQELTKQFGVYSSTATNEIRVPPACVAQPDLVGAGTYTYTLKGACGNAQTTLSVSQCKLMAYEIK